jgi:hypothetical protein
MEKPGIGSRAVKTSEKEGLYDPIHEIRDEAHHDRGKNHTSQEALI